MYFKKEFEHTFAELVFPNFDRLDAENAQFGPEYRIPRAKLYGQLERSTFCELSVFWRKCSVLLPVYFLRASWGYTHAEVVVEFS